MEALKMSDATKDEMIVYKNNYRKGTISVQLQTVNEQMRSDSRLVPYLVFDKKTLTKMLKLIDDK